MAINKIANLHMHMLKYDIAFKISGLDLYVARKEVENLMLS